MTICKFSDTRVRMCNFYSLMINVVSIFGVLVNFLNVYLYDACILDLQPVDSALEYFKSRTVVSIEVIV